jgi:outer membrane immunogenic protein
MFRQMRSKNDNLGDKTMKKLVFALILLSATAASAADLPSQQPYRAPIVVSPAFDWTGFYVGVMGGYGWSNSATVGGIAVTNADLKGAFAGGTLGYNVQMGQFVFGVEADAAWSDINHTETIFGLLTAQDKIQSFGAVTARGGIAVNNVLIYGKGGYAWMDNQISASAFGLTASESHFHDGWTIGGGIEYAFAGPWSVKGEYMFARYLSETYLAAAGGVTLAADVNTFKAGINYRFNAPITARY